MTLDDVTGLVTNSNTAAIGATNAQGMIVTINVYDKRGQAIQMRQPFRQTALSGGTYTTSEIVSSQTYKRLRRDRFADRRARRRHHLCLQHAGQGGGARTCLRASTPTRPAARRAAWSCRSRRPITTPRGRVVATQDANAVAAGGTSIINKRTLLAGTGYNGTEGQDGEGVPHDGGIFVNAFDVFGDMVSKSLNGVPSAEIDETFAYDKMSRLVTDTHPPAAAGSLGNGSTTGSAQTLVDYYVYDGLGQRTRPHRQRPVRRGGAHRLRLPGSRQRQHRLRRLQDDHRLRLVRHHRHHRHGHLRRLDQDHQPVRPHRLLAHPQRHRGRRLFRPHPPQERFRRLRPVLRLQRPPAG